MLYFLLQVMAEMGEPFSGMEVASFMSCSKGYMGECGMRCQPKTIASYMLHPGVVTPRW